MLTTIDQKLSAIKAINEEKDRVENKLTELVIGSVEVWLSGSALMDLPQTVIDDVESIVVRHYQNRKQELIAKAEDLMK